MEAQEAINTLEAGDKITVEYENTRGNITEKSGKVVHVGNGVNVDTLEEKDDGTPITFTITRWGRVKSTTGSTERRLSDGEIDVSVEGDNEEDTEDETVEELVEDTMSVFEDPDEIEEGMELTEDGERVYVVKSINGDDATVEIWEGTRRKGRRRMSVESLQNDYQSGDLVVA